MTLRVTGPRAVIERLYSDDFVEMVEHIEDYLKNSPIESYDDERFVEVDLRLHTGNSLYDKYSHLDPVALPCDEFMLEYLREHYGAAGWPRIQEYHNGKLRFYFTQS